MKKKLLTLAVSAITTLTITGVASAATDYSKYGITNDVAGDCSFASIDAKDYSGKTLNIITHAVPVMGEPTALHAAQFEELTGAKVNVVHVPFGDLFQRILIPFQTKQNAYDVLFYGSLWIGDFSPYLASVPEKYQKTASMKDVTANYKDVASWGDSMVQFPVDGDRHYMKYRTDVFDNPEMQKVFKEKTGRSLTIPQTWEEYDEIAGVFNNWDWDGDGETNYGSAEVVKRDDLMFSAFISRASAYAKHPDVKGGFFFDLETMEPLINTPGFVRGLEMFIKAQKYMPPGGNNFGLGDEIFSFGGGQTLFSYSWDDAFIQAMQDDSRIRNMVAAAPLPGSKEVWNRKSGKWDKFDTPSYAPYITWGWTSAVSKMSENKDVAFDYLCFFSNEANTLHDLQIGRFGVNPYRTKHFDIKLWTEELGWSSKTASTYVKTLSAMDDSKNRVFDLRVPGVGQFMSSMAAGVSEALAGQKDAQEALDGVAQEWKRIVARIGKDRVQSAYANVVAMEDNKR